MSRNSVVVHKKGTTPNQVSGFAAQSGFSVEILTGAGYVEGAQIRVTRSGGGFGTKPNAAGPLLWVPFTQDANGSSLGRLSGFDETQSFSYSSTGGADGSGRWVGDTSTGAPTTTNHWTGMIRSDTWASSTYDWNSLGQKIYIFRKAKKNFGHLDDSQGHNVKHFRMYNDNNADPTVFFGISNGRHGNAGTGGNAYTDYTLPFADRDANDGIQDEWYTEELMLQTNTAQDQAAGTADATLMWFVNGGDTILTRHPYTGWGPFDQSWNNSDSAGDGQCVRMYPAHYVIEGSDGWDPGPAGMVYEQDDVFVDDSWAQIFVGDNSTFTSMTEREVMIPSAWNDTTVDCYLRLGSLSSLSGKQLIIRTNDETYYYVGDFV